MDHEALTSLDQRLQEFDREEIINAFIAANEFVQIPDFIPPAVTQSLLDELSKLEGAVHRSFIPRHKKGGSVSRYDLDRLAPSFRALYEFAPFCNFLSELTGFPLIRCPEDDPHTYALYYYTEPGDHIGYHYDTSYYSGARYTVLIGLVDNSSCKLECQLYRDDESRETELLEVKLQPGTLVFFNGDNLYHRITPLGENECRIALTLEYLTTKKMNRFLRFVSNMKDSVAYFGFKQVFGRAKS